MKWTLLALILIALSATATAACTGVYSTDCNLLNETACPNYYSNTTGTNMTCLWDMGLCEEDTFCDDDLIASSSTSSSSSSYLSMLSSTTAATSTTLLAGCLPTDQKVMWSVIGITPANQEMCLYYGNGMVLQGCYNTTQTMCLNKNYDYYFLLRPTTWDIVDNPTNAVSYLMGLARPIVGWVFVAMFIFIIVYIMIRMVFRRR